MAYPDDLLHPPFAVALDHSSSSGQLDEERRRDLVDGKGSIAAQKGCAAPASRALQHLQELTPLFSLRRPDTVVPATEASNHATT
jgi:hypothetical protein